MALYSRCDSCDHSCKIVQPTGPRGYDSSVRVALIGEKPGRQEAYIGRVFVGDSGRELDHLWLATAGLNRSDVYVTNCVKCWLGGNNDTPSEEQIDTCASFHLPSELERANPEVIVLLGASACSLLRHATVNGKPVEPTELDKDHGRPVMADGKVATVRCPRYFGDWEGVVWTFYHPASALHDTASMTPMMEDFETLGRWLRGQWKPPALEFTPVYEELETADDFLVATDEVAKGWGPVKGAVAPWVPTDTENDGPRPWSLQFSTAPTNGYLIRAANTRVLSLYTEWVKEAESQGGGVLCHNRTHDLEVGAKLKVWEWGEWPRTRDTQEEAFNQGNLPQGLKSLGWRLLGVRMRGWEDTVAPPSRKKALRWLREALGYAQDNLRVRKWEDFKTPRGTCPLCHSRVGITQAGVCARHKGCNGGGEPPGEVLGLRVGEWVPGQAEKDLRRILSHADRVEYDIWEKVVEAKGQLLVDSTGVVADCGPMPIVSIANCDPKIALDYSCQDATICGLVGEVLDVRAQQLVTAQAAGKRGEWEIMEEDLL